jgi:hypothetical protein
VVVPQLQGTALEGVLLEEVLRQLADHVVDGREVPAQPRRMQLLRVADSDNPGVLAPAAGSRSSAMSRSSHLTASSTTSRRATSAKQSCNAVNIQQS